MSRVTPAAAATVRAETASAKLGRSTAPAGKQPSLSSGDGRFGLADVNAFRGTQRENKDNCLGCAIAVDAFQGGADAVALPVLLPLQDQYKALVRLYGEKAAALLTQDRRTNQLTPGPERTVEDIEEQLRASGEGARGLIVASSRKGGSHIFNAEFRDGRVRYLDGQLGGEVFVLSNALDPFGVPGPRKILFGDGEDYRLWCNNLTFMQTAPGSNG